MASRRPFSRSKKPCLHDGIEAIYIFQIMARLRYEARSVSVSVMTGSSRSNSAQTPVSQKIITK